MKKWSDQVNSQRRSHMQQQRSSSRATTVVPDTEFYSMKDQQLENPHKMYHDDDDEDDDYDAAPVASGYPLYGNYPVTRNDSQTSFRSRSTTGESVNRGPPRQFPLGAQTPILSVRTGGPAYPGDPGDSYFSPATESPISTRSSGMSGMSSMYGFRQSGAPPMPGTWEDHRYTAPAMPRQQVNSYQPNPRATVQRPSLPPTAHSMNGPVHSRLRSASSPDIANPLRRYDPAHVPPMPDLPVFPNAYAYAPGVLERSQSNSPAQAATTLPMRSNTQSPGTQQARLAQGGPRSIPSALQAGQPEFAMGMAQRQMSYIQPGMMEAAMQPSLQAPAPITSPAPSEGPLPSQLKVKVHAHSAGTSMTFVVSPNITFQSLKDRIDVKLQRSTNLSLSSGQVKLKYLDDDDYISISSDEDVQMAFETWRESQRAQNLSGIGEIDLYIQ
jgi:cell division control protein 24